MAELIKMQYVELPELYVVGKQIKVSMKEMGKNNPIPAFWDECFASGVFATVEQLKEDIYDPAYVGWISDLGNEEGTFTYICGMLMKKDCIISKDGFVSRNIKASTVSIGWIQGKGIPDIAANAHALTQAALEKDGYSSDNMEWSMELYNCPRFTEPDKDGKMIMDYYIPCKHK